MSEYDELLRECELATGTAGDTDTLHRCAAAIRKLREERDEARNEKHTWCQAPSVAQCARQWESDHQEKALEACGLADEFSGWGCDTIGQVAEKLLTARADRDRLAAEVEELREERDKMTDWATQRFQLQREANADRDRLAERVRELEQELEKARFAARQFCGAHIGVKFDECPRCWGERQGEKAAHFDRRVRELERIADENYTELLDDMDETWGYSPGRRLRVDWPELHAKIASRVVHKPARSLRERVQKIEAKFEALRADFEKYGDTHDPACAIYWASACSCGLDAARERWVRKS